MKNKILEYPWLLATLSKEDKLQRRLFIKELPKLFLLVTLYSFQGLPLGFFLSTVPILFKKYLTYSEIGVIMMCTMPFSFKVLWSPFVEFYHIERVGKRKSWIIPTQLIMCCILFYLMNNLEQLLIDKHVNLVAILLTTLVFVITCQDIAVDSWAVEMLLPQFTTYGSSSQSVGQRIGTFLSTSVFISLNSAEFCAKWIYKKDDNAKSLPLSSKDGEATGPVVLTMKNFMMAWVVF